jgi:hypothetical protein
MKARDPKTIAAAAFSAGLLLAAVVSYFTIDAGPTERGEIIKLTLIGAFVLAALVVLAIGLSTSVTRARRALAKAEAVSIDGAPVGQISKLVGVVELIEPLDAPLSGRPCAYYRVSAEQTLSAMEVSDRPFEPLLIEHGVDFLLVDESGKALVRMDDAVVAVTRDQEYGERGVDHSRQEALLKGAGRELAPGLQFTEGVLEPGERIAVLGRIERVPDQGHAVAVAAPAGGRIQVTDDPALL